MSEILYVEGPDHDSVCRQLLSEYGRGVRLLSTERVRHGGMMGFFAREYVGVRFELTDDDAPSLAGAPAAAESLHGGPRDFVDVANQPAPDFARDFAAVFAPSVEEPATKISISRSAVDAAAAYGLNSRQNGAGSTTATASDAPAATSFAAALAAGFDTENGFIDATGYTDLRPGRIGPSATNPGGSPSVLGHPVRFPSLDDLAADIETTNNAALAALDLAEASEGRLVGSALYGPQDPVTAEFPRIEAEILEEPWHSSAMLGDAVLGDAVLDDAVLGDAVLDDSVTGAPSEFVAWLPTTHLHPTITALPLEPLDEVESVDEVELVDEDEQAERFGRHSLAAAGAIPAPTLVTPADPVQSTSAPSAPVETPPVHAPTPEAVAPEAAATPEAVAPEAAATPEPVAPEAAESAAPVAESAPPRRAPEERLAALSELHGVGVPAWMTLDLDDNGLYHSIEQVVLDLPAAPAPPRRAGEVLVLVGPYAAARIAAEAVSEQLRLPDDDIWVAGAWQSIDRSRRISGPMEAARVAAELRVGDVPAVVVVATSPTADPDEQFGWLAQVVAALAPTAVWAVVDAGRKADDVRGELDGLGSISALAVYATEHTASPATVWDLEIPVALIDGRKATPGRWAAVLFDRLSGRAPKSERPAATEHRD